MDFANRVASSYQFVLDDLKSANKHIITALTLLALDDIEYHETIVDVIVEHTKKVSVHFLVHFIQLFHPFNCDIFPTCYYLWQQVNGKV